MNIPLETLATKVDVAGLRAEVADTREEIANLLYETRDEIIEHKADNFKWMFIFWIGQVGATLGVIFLFFKQ